MYQTIFNIFRPPSNTEADSHNQVVMYWASVFLLMITGTIFLISLVTGNLLTPSLLFNHLLFLFSILNLLLIDRGLTRVGRYLIVLGFWAAALAGAFGNISLGVGVVVGLPVVAILAAALLGYRQTLLISLINSGLIFLIAQLQVTNAIAGQIELPRDPQYVFTAAFVGFLNLWLATGIALVSLSILNRFLKVNLNVRQSQSDILGNLEELVRERTADIQLASEISKRISTYQDLDELLSQAVTTIQDRFHLYHVQIYLTDLLNQNLILKSATGEIGENLISFSHRLPIGPGSINGTAAYQRESVLVEDINQSSLFKPNLLLPNTRAELSIPLTLQDELLGVLNIQASDFGNLTETSMLIFETVASGLSIAINNANLYQELAKSRAETQAIAQSITVQGWNEFLSQQDERTIYRKEFGSLRPDNQLPETISHHRYEVPIKVLESEVGQIIVENPQIDWSDQETAVLEAIARQVATRMESLRLLEEAKQSRAQTEQIIRRITKENWSQVQGLDNLGLDSLHFDGKDLREVHRGEAKRYDLDIQSPISIQGEEIGQLALTPSELFDYPELEDIVASVTESLGTHLENLRLTSETERRANELSILYDINQTIQGETNPDILLSKIGGALHDAFNSTTVYVAIYEESTKLIHFPYFVTNDDRGMMVQQKTPQRYGEGLTSKIIETGQPIFLQSDSMENLIASKGAVALDDHRTEQGVTYIGVPIKRGKRVIGVISIQDTMNRANLSENEVALLTSIANSVGISIQNTQLFNQTQQALSAAQKQSKELQSLNRIITAASSTTSLSHSLQIVADELLNITPADQIGIMMLDSDRKQLRMSAAAGGNEDFDFDSVFINVDESPSTLEVMNSRKMVLFDDVPNDDRFESIRHLMDARNIMSMIIAPIIGTDGVTGTIGLDITERNRQFTQEDLNLINAIAIQASTIIENNRLLAETRKRAEREARVRNITDRIRRGSDRETILSIARREIARIIGSQHAVAHVEEPEKEVYQPDSGMLVIPEEWQQQANGQGAQDERVNGKNGHGA